MDSLADICGKTVALLLSLIVLAACPAHAQQDGTDRDVAVLRHELGPRPYVDILRVSIGADGQATTRAIAPNTSRDIPARRVVAVSNRVSLNLAETDAAAPDGQAFIVLMEGRVRIRETGGTTLEITAPRTLFVDDMARVNDAIRPYDPVVAFVIFPPAGFDIQAWASAEGR